MSSTTFVDGVTTIQSSWLNDVNTEVYTNTHVNSITAGTDITVSSSTGNPTIALASTIHSNTTGSAASAATATTATQLASTLGVAGGGTGLTTLTANGVILGNGTAAPIFVVPSTSGNVLTSNGTTWTSTAPAPISTYNGANGQVFTSNGTFTIPAGVTAIKVTVVGGGGGGGTD